MLTNKELREQVLKNQVIKGLLEQIEDAKEREKTVIAIEGMLDQLQGKFNGLSQAYEEIAKKQASK
jgi:hypothetical protein